MLIPLGGGRHYPLSMKKELDRLSELLYLGKTAQNLNEYTDLSDSEVVG